MDGKKVEEFGKGLRSCGCAIMLLVFVIIPFVFVGCSVLRS